MSRYKQAYNLHNMVPAPAGSATVQVIFKTEGGILLCYGTAAYNSSALTAASTYEAGCIYIRTSTGKVYVNVTTTFTSAASWSIIGSVTS